MKRILSIATLVALMSLLLGVNASAQDCLKAGPYLQELTQDGVTIVFENTVKAFSWVELRLKGNTAPGVKYYQNLDGQYQAYDQLQAPKVAVPTQNFIIRVDGLKSNTEYEYRVCTQEVNWMEAYKASFGSLHEGEWHTFSTLNPDATEHHIVVVSDLHCRPDVLEQQLRALDYATADHIVYAGDMMNNMQLTTNTVMPVEEPYASFVNKSVQLFATEHDFTMVRGDHETKGDIARHFRDYFPHQSKRLYNAYRWGDLMVVVLDGGEAHADDNPTARSTNLALFAPYREQQARWLAGVVESAEWKQAKYRIVFSHFPVTNEALDEDNAGAAQFASMMLPVLNKAQVDLMVAGHRHPEGYTMIAKGSQGNNFPVLVQGYNFGVRIDIADGSITVKTAGGTTRAKVKKLKR